VSSLSMTIPTMCCDMVQPPSGISRAGGAILAPAWHESLNGVFRPVDCAIRGYHALMCAYRCATVRIGTRRPLLASGRRAALPDRGLV
jgi:hypothetical protein